MTVMALVTTDASARDAPRDTRWPRSRSVAAKATRVGRFAAASWAIANADGIETSASDTHVDNSIEASRRLTTVACTAMAGSPLPPIRHLARKPDRRRKPGRRHGGAT